MSDNMKRLIIGLVCVGVLIVVLFTILHRPGKYSFSGTESMTTTDSDKKSDSNNTENKEKDHDEKMADESQKAADNTQEKEEKVYTPTFMYFVKKSDETYATEMASVKELSTEYDGKINFEIIDVEEQAERAKNFSFVEGQTPALIMLNTKNDISAIELKCAEKETLKSDIEQALK